MKEKDREIEELLKNSDIIQGRNAFITNNNMCIIETCAFIDNILLNRIIRPMIFNDNYENINGISDIFVDRISFMDKYKIACKIANHFGVERFKKVDDYLKMRNNIAHNLTSVLGLDLVTKESEIQFANQIISWTEYKKKINEWATLSLEMAKFLVELVKKVDNSENFTVFAYCKVEGDCVLVQHNLIYPEPEGEYTCFFKNGFNMDLLNYLNDEIKFMKENA